MKLNLLKSLTLITLSLLTLPVSSRDIEAQRSRPMTASRFTESLSLADDVKNQKVMRPIVRGRDAAAPATTLRAPLQTITRPQDLTVLPAEAPTLKGAVVYADGGWSALKYGLYDINPTECTMFLKGPRALDGGVLTNDGIFYAHEMDMDPDLGGVFINGYDVETGKLVDEDMSFSYTFGAADITVDPTTGEAYGIFWKDNDLSGYQLAHINYKSALKKVTKLMDLPGDWCAIAADPEGHIYAVRREIEGSGNNATCVSSTLYLIVDTQRELVSKIGDVTGALPFYASSMTFDETGNTIYWNVCTKEGTSAIYSLSPTTGKATLLYNLPGNEEIMGLYVPTSNTPEIPTGMPAAPTELVANFPNGGLTGTISFKAPSTDASGAVLLGDLNYVITDKGEKIKEGTCKAGATVSVDITLTTNGSHEFAVTVSNSNGTSEAATITHFAGVATPMPPSNVALTVKDGVVTLTWDRVTSAATNGYFNADDITYIVTRNLDNTEVLTGTKANTFTEPLPQTTGYAVHSYYVTAVNGSMKSRAALSNNYIVGKIEPPYLEEFSNAGTFSTFTAGSWKYDEGKQAARIAFNNGWLISPPIHLKAGVTYAFSIDVAAYSSWQEEEFEVCYGTAPNAAAMTTVLIDKTKTASANYMTYTNYIEAKSEGDYYIGINLMTDKNDTWGLYVDNIKLDAPLNNNAPADVTEFKVVGDPDGKKIANISLVAPTKTFGGAQLTSIDKIEIINNKRLVHTFSAPQPGSTLTCVDNEPANGLNTYTAIVTKGDDKSEGTSATAFVGLDTPIAPTGLTVTETSDGIVTVNWENVTTGKNGAAINPALITYDVATFDGVNMDFGATDAAKGPVTFRAIEDGQQEFLQIIVFPIIKQGDEDEIEGEAVISPSIPLGTPARNYRESFTQGMISSPIGIDTQSSNVQVFQNDGNTTAQDDDNGFIAIQAKTLGAVGSILLPKVNLNGMVDPALTFYSFTIVDPSNGHASRNKITVSVAEPNKEFTPVLQTTVDAIGNELGWHPVNVPLTAYAGKTVIVKITAEYVNMTYTLFDNLRLGSSLDHDVAITHISGPSRANAGEDFPVNVLYTNDGVKAAENFSIELYLDDELISTRPAGNLQPGASGAAPFTVTMHPLATENVSIVAKVAYPDDANDANDTSEAISVRPFVSTLPVVTDLAGEIVDNKPSLTWSEPAFADYLWAQPVRESFETGGSFATEFDGWTFIDNDKQPTGGFSSLEMPGITDGSLQSFWVFDSSLEQFQGSYKSSFTGISGDKYLVAMFTHSGSNDDWAISPELSGENQFISFYARRYSTGIAESFEFLYSDTEPTVESFKLIDKVQSVPRQWTLYEYELPQGARYFAVRYCSTDAMMLMLDDFTFTPKGEPGKLELKGFNIYRNGKRLNGSPVEDFEFTDDGTDSNLSTYVATAVYSQGESAGSNGVTLDTSGVDIVDTDGVTVSGQRGYIVITGAADTQVNIFDTTGRMVFSQPGSDKMIVELHSAVYIVTVNGASHKCIVR